MDTHVTPREHLVKLLVGMWTTQAAATAARLGLADHLAEAPSTSEELAAALGLHPRSLRRLMRALESLGLVTADAGGHHALTDAGALLRTDHSQSLRNLFIAETDHIHWQCWERLADAVRSGTPRPPSVVGMPVFDYYAAHPADAAQFARAMEDVSQMTAQVTIGSYDFRSVRRMIDVGGGNGSMAIAVLEHSPATHATVFDLPYVRDEAMARIRTAGVDARCGFEPGDFFERVPAGADLHLLKFILHDWDDEPAVRVLRSCRAAIEPGGRLLVIEMVLPETPQPDLVQFMDLNMLVMTGGLERTVDEYRALFTNAGFALSRVIPTNTPFQLLEGTPLS